MMRIAPIITCCHRDWTPTITRPAASTIGMKTPTTVPNIVPLPPKCPDLNAAENVWQFMRDNWLPNRVFACYENIVDHCCAAWNKLQPWHIMALGLRDWAHRF